MSDQSVYRSSIIVYAHTETPAFIHLHLLWNVQPLVWKWVSWWVSVGGWVSEQVSEWVMGGWVDEWVSDGGWVSEQVSVGDWWGMFCHVSFLSADCSYHEEWLIESENWDLLLCLCAAAVVPDVSFSLTVFNTVAYDYVLQKQSPLQRLCLFIW